MKRVLQLYIRVMDDVNHVVGYVLAAMLAVMTVLIGWQVFTRFVIGNSSTFSEEVSRFLMVWLTLLGAAYAVRHGTLLAVDILPDKLRGTPQKALKLAASALSLCFYVILVYYGWQIASVVAYQNAPATGVSMRWPMLALAVGGALMFLNTLVTMVEETVPGIKVSHEWEDPDGEVV